MYTAMWPHTPCSLKSTELHVRVEMYVELVYSQDFCLGLVIFPPETTLLQIQTYMYVHIQSTLSNPDTPGKAKSVLINKVS